MYHTMLLSGMDINTFNSKVGLNAVKYCINGFWKRKIRLMLICDIALILLDNSLITNAVSIINSILPQRKQAEVNRILVLLSNSADIDKRVSFIEPLITQYRLNQSFLSQKEHRIIVTANTSAGKSTLINALIGKPLARTSQEVCTGNVCYFYNKAFEDGNVHLATKTLTMSATDEDLYNYEWAGHIAIASYFAHSTPLIPKLCVIDTPGVDAALYRKHTDITYAALLYEKYDTILYVVCPTNLGTDAEQKHLKWVAQNLSQKRIVFVLNKLDNYHNRSDSIEESVQGLKEDLLKIGFQSPIICPISAYFSYLLKLKMTEQALSDDESDEYSYLSKRFNRSSHDLSPYYSNTAPKEDESEEVTLCKRAGIYGLEKMIYGG